MIIYNIYSKMEEKGKMNRQEQTLVAYTANKLIIQNDFDNYFKLSRLAEYAKRQVIRGMYFGY